MSLMQCRECGHDVSSHAAVCQNCGYPIASGASADAATARQTVTTERTSKRYKNQFIVCWLMMIGSVVEMFAASDVQGGIAFGGFVFACAFVWLIVAHIAAWYANG